MSFPVTVGLAIGDEKISYASNQNGRILGTKAITPDGRIFRWALNGGTALEAGVAVQTMAEIHASVFVNGLTIINATVTGVTTITVTMATTPLTADLYADGDLVVDTSPGQAMYRIKTHESAVSGGNAQFTLYESDEIKDLMTSGTTLVGFRRNPYTSVIVAPATPTGNVIGVTPISVAANRYFWLQTWGLCLANLDTAPTIGGRVIFTGASAGHLDMQSTSSADTTGANEQSKLPTIGVAQTVGAGADKYHRIFLTISA